MYMYIPQSFFSSTLKNSLHCCLGKGGMKIYSKALFCLI